MTFLLTLKKASNFATTVSYTIDSSVLLGGVRRRQNGLRFFSYTVEKRVDLLDFTVAHKSRGDSELLESSFPTGPVVRSPEVKWRWSS